MLLKRSIQSLSFESPQQEGLIKNIVSFSQLLNWLRIGSRKQGVLFVYTTLYVQGGGETGSMYVQH